MRFLSQFPYTLLRIVQKTTRLQDGSGPGKSVFKLSPIGVAMRLSNQLLRQAQLRNYHLGDSLVGTNSPQSPQSL